MTWAPQLVKTSSAESGLNQICPSSRTSTFQSRGWFPGSRLSERALSFNPRFRKVEGRQTWTPQLVKTSSAESGLNQICPSSRTSTFQSGGWFPGSRLSERALSLVPRIAAFGTGLVLRPSFLKSRRTTSNCLAAFELGASTCQDKLGRIGIEPDLPNLENFNFSTTRVVPWIVTFGTGLVLQPSFLKS